MDEELERRIIRLIATDRIEVPISSMSGKLKRRKSRLGQEIELPKAKYVGERVYARVVEEDKMKARTLKEAIVEFSQQYPTHGKVLQGIITEKRLQKETHLYFGVNEGCRLTEADYIAVLRDLGFGEVTARGLYNELIEVSRNLSRKRGSPERSVLIGKCNSDSEE